MGLCWDSAFLISRMVSEKQIAGESVITFGRSNVLFTIFGLDKILRILELGRVDNEKIKLASEKNQKLVDKIVDAGKALEGNAITPEVFFACIGFSVTDSLDFSDYEGATVIHDLNRKIEDENLIEKYDLVHDAGTMEHVFNVPMVLENVFNLLKLGGVIIHENPMNGWVDHGFFQFSPTFYADYYEVNQFDIIKSHIYWSEIGTNPSGFTWQTYKPGILDALFRGHVEAAHWLQLRDGKHNLYNNFFSARKVEKSTCGIAPTQGYCLRHSSWNDG